jgi:serpin B
MTYAGAVGETKSEMATVLHLPNDESAVHDGFAAITADLTTMSESSQREIADPDRRGGPNTALEIRIANRLFGQSGYPFERPFLDLLAERYQAPMEPMDFIQQPEPSRIQINTWAEEQTAQRIKDLIPPGLIDEETRLVLANAIHLKAAWQEEFKPDPEMPFFVNGKEEVRVTGLTQQRRFGYRRIDGGTVVSVPYAADGLQFLLIVPDANEGLVALERSADAAMLVSCAALPQRMVRLHLPKLKLEPGGIRLGTHLTAMGMSRAFDRPKGSADFSRMAPRKPDDYLRISEVVHKAFLALDEHGTEAAAATAVVMMRTTAMLPEPEEPVEVRADRPFAFAIQHTPSGLCLFLGRVTDPR